MFFHQPPNWETFKVSMCFSKVCFLLFCIFQVLPSDIFGSFIRDLFKGEKRDLKFGVSKGHLDGFFLWYLKMRMVSLSFSSIFF